MRVITTIFLFVLLSSTNTIAADKTEVGIAQHELIAEQLSLGKAFKEYQRLIELDERSKATPYAKRVYDLAKTRASDNKRHQSTYAAAAHNYGRLLVYSNEQDQAAKVLNESLSTLETLHGEKSLELIDTLMDLGHARTKFFQRSSGRKYYNRAIKIAQANSSENSPLVGQLYFEMSERMLVNGAGSRGIAIENLTKAYEIFRERLGPSNPRTALAAYRLGEVRNLQRKFKDAAPLLENAVAVFDEQAPLEKYTIKTHSMLIKAYEELGKSDLATKHCQAVGKITEARKEKFPSGFSLMPLHVIKPTYPRSANVRGIEGFATLELTVDKEGRPKDLRTLRWHGSEDFVRAAKQAAQKFRYAVQFKDGKPVETQGVRYKFTFEFAN